MLPIFFSIRDGDSVLLLRRAYSGWLFDEYHHQRKRDRPLYKKGYQNDQRDLSPGEPMRDHECLVFEHGPQANDSLRRVR